MFLLPRVLLALSEEVDARKGLAISWFALCNVPQGGILVLLLATLL